MLGRGRGQLVAAVLGAAMAACSSPLSDQAAPDAFLPRTPATPSPAQDGGATPSDAGDSAATSDASGEDTGTAPVEACATQPYCDDNLLVTPSAGRLFCSRETVVCPFGCELLEYDLAQIASFAKLVP